MYFSAENKMKLVETLAFGWPFPDLPNIINLSFWVEFIQYHIYLISSNYVDLNNFISNKQNLVIKLSEIIPKI